MSNLTTVVACTQLMLSLATSGTATAAGSVYVVRKGDTAGQIAHRTHVSLPRLAALNPERDLDHLAVGMKLKVKGRVPEPPSDEPGPFVGPELPAEVAAAREIPLGEPPAPPEPRPSVASIVRPAPVDPDHLNLLWPVETRSVSCSWRPGRTVGAKAAKGAPRKAKRRVRYRGRHLGVDMTAPMGTTVLAAEGGVVTSVGRHRQYGNYIIIDHGNGVTTLYAHHRANHVREGDVVVRGEPIAEVGRTGNATGPHLHFELKIDGRHVNPLPVIDDLEAAPTPEQITMARARLQVASPALLADKDPGPAPAEEHEPGPGLP
ncbi:MAG TPA: LysM peptidoglycan-binding domain-containing M23 family metallopeptidase [Holophaga sp.]|nr:LysM peptidoglycan-binding domain-containing M23 family metallopeptidase [Holophaga sp.]